MIDTYLFRKLLAECPSGAHIILLGDVDQLGPIAPGQPFADLIESEKVPVTRLDQVFRFAEGGAIAVAARAMNCGDVDVLIDGHWKVRNFDFFRVAMANNARSSVIL